MPKSEIPATKFGLEIQRLMREHNPPMSMIQLSDALGASYEHVRLIVRGKNLPSKYFVTALAKVLEADEARLHEIIKEDRFAKQFGGIIPVSGTTNPEIQPFERAWPLLEEDQKNHLLRTLAVYITENQQALEDRKAHR